MRSCTRCHLSKIAKRIVNNKGNRNADILVISDNPSTTDELFGHILSGQEGKLLDAMFDDAFLNAGVLKEDIYITSCIRCRPTDTWRGETREPENAEILGCTYHVMNTVFKVKPRIIFLMGNVTEKYYQKEFTDAHTIHHVAFLLKQGGKASPWYQTNLRIIEEALKNDR